MDARIVMGAAAVLLGAAFFIGICVYVVAKGSTRRPLARREWGTAVTRALGHPFHALSDCGFGWMQMAIALLLPAIPALALFYLAQPNR